ncbi:MAG: DUF4232 domain-containing protein [Gaiellaceae bacterium]
MRRLLTAFLPAFTALAAGVVLAASASGSPAAPPCSGASLSGLFSLVLGSPGAGNVVYVLRVRNRSASACFVSGLPAVRLLGLRHQPLPTHAFAARPGQLTAVRVQLAPGAYASASARFSPDVPGVGESGRGACEPKAFFLRVRPQGGGSLLAAVRPPTPVCEHGGMSFTAFVAGRHVPTP